MNDSKSRDIFYGVVAIATLIVAVIGATLAYFSITANSAEGAVNAENNYFVYESEHEKGDYVLCLCVAPEYRRLHIGKELLLHYLKGKKEVSLECLADNSGALAMYGAAGFCVEKEYDGYSAPGTSPVRVVRMIYKANSHSRYNY